MATAIDIPIGLPSGSEHRKADVLARAFLKEIGSASSVFFTPPRNTLVAETPKKFQELHRQATGRGAGLPVWGIVPKIRDVNAVMEKDPRLQERIYEFHPELAWRRVCGTSLHSKLSAMGALQRLQANGKGIKTITFYLVDANRLRGAQRTPATRNGGFNYRITRHSDRSV